MAPLLVIEAEAVKHGKTEPERSQRVPNASTRRKLNIRERGPCFPSEAGIRANVRLHLTPEGFPKESKRKKSEGMEPSEHRALPPVPWGLAFAAGVLRGRC